MVAFELRALAPGFLMQALKLFLLPLRLSALTVNLLTLPVSLLMLALRLFTLPALYYPVICAAVKNKR